MIALGTSKLNKAYLGSNQIKKIYQGTDLLWPSRLLPAGYTRCEYLHADGNQYIDTGYAYTDKYFKIVQKFRKESSMDTNTFGVDKSAVPRQMHGHTWHMQAYIGNSGPIGRLPITLDADIDYSSMFDPVTNVFSVNVNGNNFTYNGSNGWDGTDASDFIFATKYNANTATYKMIGRIYFHMMYDSNGLVRNFIPALDPNGRPCMYDTVTEKPFYNLGTGEFTYNLL